MVKKSLVIITFVISIILILTIFSDYALCYQYQVKNNVDCPGDKSIENANFLNTYEVPYGSLWMVFNPMRWTQFPYRIILAILVTISFILQMIFLKEHYDIILLWNCSNIIWALMHWHQNLSVIMFAPFAVAFYIWPNWSRLKRFLMGSLMTCLLVFQKLPIGWNNDMHWWCAKYCSLPIGYPLNILPVLDPPHALAYTIVALWTIVPILMFFKAKPKGL